MVKSILTQIESKRARELEVPDTAPLPGTKGAQPSSKPGRHTLSKSHCILAAVVGNIHHVCLLTRLSVEMLLVFFIQC